MKKRLVFILLSILTLASFAACGDEEVESILEVNTSELIVDHQGGVFQLGVSSNISWSAVSAENWCVLENYINKGDGSVVVRVTPNTANSERVARISVNGGSLMCEVIVKQLGTDENASDQVGDNEINEEGEVGNEEPQLNAITLDIKNQLPHLVENQSLCFNLWASNNVSWVGSFDGSNIPVVQYIDYVKVSVYDASTQSFKEAWTDEFESFNTSRWNKGNWKMELVQLTADNVVVEDGVLQLKMTKQANEDGSYKYYGAELYSKETFKYGRFEAKMKMACASGCISSMFLYYNNSDKGGAYQWNELDIEVLGKNPNAFQSNIITGKKGALLTTEKIHKLNYSVNSDYHVYVLEWTPEYVLWSIDGVEMRRTVSQQ